MHDEKPLSIEEGLYYFFKGATKCEKRSSELLLIDDWKVQAQKELERRKRKVLESLSFEDIDAIANGNVNLNDIIRKAAQSHKE